jgi:site-specific recombinase XerD
MTINKNPRHYKKGAENYLTTAEIQLFFKQIKDVRDIAMFSLMYFFGLRVSEMCDLKMGDIDLKNKLIYIFAKKGGISGNYRLNQNAIDKLMPYLKIRNKMELDSPYLFISKKKNRISRNQISTLTLKYCEMAELPRKSSFSHIFRHSIAIHLASAGVDLPTVQMILRHKDIKTTMHYFGFMNESKLKLQEEAMDTKYIAKI